MSDNFDFLKRRHPPISMDDEDALKEEIANRKILKINRGGSQSEAKPIVQNVDVKFFSGATTTPAQPSVQAAPSNTAGFFPQSTSETPKPAAQAAEPLVKLPEPSGASLFNFKIASTPAGPSAGQGLFSGTTSFATEEKKQPAASLFGTSNGSVPTGGLFANILAPAEPVKKVTPEKPAPQAEPPKPTIVSEEKPKAEAPAPQASGLSGLFGNGTKPSTGGLFGDSKPPGTSLFGDLKGGNTAGTSLFGTGASSLFGEKKPEADKQADSGKPAFETSGLFAAAPTTYIKTKTGLFDGLLNSSVNNGTGCGSGLLGNGTAPQTSLFSKPSGTAAAGADDDDEAGVDPDEEVVPGQEDNVDPTKATGSYKYESKTEILVVKSVNNYKKGTVPALGVGSASIEKYENGTTYLIFRNGAKVILHNSMIIKKVSKSGFMKGKTDAIWVDTYEMVEGKPTMITCKLQFSDEESCTHFKKVFDDLVAS